MFKFYVPKQKVCRFILAHRSSAVWQQTAAMRVLRDVLHWLPVRQRTVFKLCYFVRSCVVGVAPVNRCGFCPADLQSFNGLIQGQEDQLFPVINHNPQHLLHHLLPPPSVASQNYELRHRTHNRSLPDRVLRDGHLSDANFISRIIFKDTY